MKFCAKIISDEVQILKIKFISFSSKEKIHFFVDFQILDFSEQR